jgi:N-acetylglutamate synthase-like GNAT family acetyltransferase
VPVDFNIARDGFSIRSAVPGDAKALRMLLPEMQERAAYFAAIDGKHRLVIGAAAATRSRRQQPLVGPGVALRVIEPCRRSGVATALLLQLESAAKTAGANALYVARRVDEGSAEKRGWEWLGFAPAETVEEHSLPVDEIESRLGAVVDRLRANGRIPVNAQVIPLYQADLAAVLQLHLDHMGGDRGELYRKLRGEGAGAFLPRQSRVLLVDEKVKGCLLAHRAGEDTITVDANIVDPSLRGGWANALLKIAAFRGRPAGVRQFCFTSFDHYTDTRSFTDKMGGTTTKRTMLMVRPIQSHNAGGNR